MNDLDIYYRALLNYRALTRQDRECSLFRKAMAQADTENDRIVVTRNICTVDEDWVIAIEEGLVFVEKAIREERQFIYSNGEVVPIEKVKQVSKDSVQHLAKHSNLITKKSEGEDLIPDKLYSVERLNDYAVYENRFLYMLLCYLRDFVTIRYNKILDLTNQYDGMLQIKKEVTLPKQTVTYSVDLHDVRRDDPYLREHNAARDIIDRMDLILKTIMAFLNTPLMECAGKAAMLKPPITKTNVLKMDNNFKGAVALYDFIIAYEKPGYTSESRMTEIAPFGDELAEEIAEAGALLTFLTYEYGLDLNGKLKNNYEAEEERRKALEIAKKQEQLDALKRRLAGMSDTPNEYILALEKQIKLLENEARQLEPLRDQINSLREIEDNLTEELKVSREEAEDMRRELAESEDKHLKQMDQVKSELNERIHDNLVRHEQEMKALEKACNERIDAVNQQMRDMTAKMNEEVCQARLNMEESIRKMNALSESYDELLEEKRLCEARVKALRSQGGESFEDDECTDRESFDELEKELEAFVRFYENRWGITKKKIRKKLLNYESLKGQNGQN